MTAKRSKLDTLERHDPASRGAWRAWLRENHLISEGVWLVTPKKSSGLPRIDYDDAVEELLCFGWIDSLTRSLDEERSMLLCTPRKPASNWSRHNKERVERLEAAGLMADRGREVVALAKESGAWGALDEVDKLVAPSDLEERFRAHAGSKGYWDAFPRGARRAILEWIAVAKRAETRAARIEQTASLAAQNIRVNEWRQEHSGNRTSG